VARLPSEERMTRCLLISIAHFDEVASDRQRVHAGTKNVRIASVGVCTMASPRK